MKGVRHLPTLRKKDSKDLSYPAAAAPLLRGMLVSTLARCNVQLDPTRQMLAKPSCINKGSATTKFLAWMELVLPDQKQDVCQIKLGDATFGELTACTTLGMLYTQVFCMLTGDLMKLICHSMQAGGCLDCACQMCLT